MKKLLCGVLAFTFFSLAIPVKKAEAGFMVLAATQEFVWHHKYETLDRVIVIGLPVTMIATGVFAVGIAGFPINNASIISGVICLDENLEGKRDEVKSALISRYTFLDDMTVVENLAERIIPRYAGAKDAEGNAMITIPEPEILAAIEGMDLSIEQVNELVETLSK